MFKMCIRDRRWLIQNSWKYGFVLRYPTNKNSITGVGYEPWHYRYVGKEHAKKMCIRDSSIMELTHLLSKCVFLYYYLTDSFLFSITIADIIKTSESKRE